MRSMVSAFLVLAFAAVEIAGTAEAAQTGEDPRREQAVAEYGAKVKAANSLVLLAAADSNDARLPIPQLSADTNAWAGLQRLIETNRLVVPQVSLVEKPTPAEPQQRHPMLMILAVLGVLVGSYLLQRWRSRSDPP